MYDLFSFIDSPDIREYNRQLNTEFTPLEQAVLISLSDLKTLEEKIKALSDLLEIYKSEEFKDTRRIVSNTILMWRYVVDEYLKRTDLLFVVKLIEDGFSVSDDKNNYFKSFDDAISFLKNEKKEYYSNEGDPGFTVWIECHDFSDSYTLLIMNKELNIISIASTMEIYKKFNLEYHGEILEDDFFVYVPLPFKRGDIVKIVFPHNNIGYGVMSSDFPDKAHSRLTGDVSDMIVFLDSYSEELKFDYYDGVQYLYLQFCKNEELPKDQKVLINLSEARKDSTSDTMYRLLMEYSKVHGEFKGELLWNY